MKAGIHSLIRKPLPVSPDMDITEVVNLAIEKGIYCFPVIDRGQFLGINTEIVKVPFEFQIGSNKMMKLNHNKGGPK